MSSDPSTSNDSPKKPAKTGGAKDMFWNPRFWNGMTMPELLRLLSRYGFRIAPRRWGMAAICGSISVLNSGLRAASRIKYGRQIRETEVTEDPLFIVGHWRSGTTMLHEMLIGDDRFTYATTYDVFAAPHFLSFAGAMKSMVGWTLPKKRPMDNMATGWDYPQEDEFALAVLGAGSPYTSLIAFPNSPFKDLDFLDLHNVTEKERDHWKAVFLDFLKCLTVREPKRIVLKSPTHTARVKTLLELFPKAQFLHITRDPYTIFPSSMHLWQRLGRVHGFQVPKNEDLQERVLTMFERMYGAFEEDKKLLGENQYHQLSYEDLVADPVGQLRGAYDKLSLGGFERLEPSLQSYVERTKGYRPNKYEFDDELRAEIARRWSIYFETYGYEKEVASG